MRLRNGVFYHAGTIVLGLMAAGCSLIGLPDFPNNIGATTDPSFKLVATASSGTLTTDVEYAEFGDESRFEINVAGGVPGSQIDIQVNGVVVATITLDGAGSAHVEYSSSPDESTDDLPLPDTFVAPQAGDSVAVGELQSLFDEDSSDDDGDSEDNANANDNDDSTNNANGNTNDNGDDDSADNDNGDLDDNLNDNSDDSGNDNADDIVNGNTNVDNGSDDDLGNANSNINGNDNNSGNDNR